MMLEIVVKEYNISFTFQKAFPSRLFGKTTRTRGT